MRPKAAVQTLKGYIRRTQQDTYITAGDHLIMETALPHLYFNML